MPSGSRERMAAVALAMMLACALSASGDRVQAQERGGSDNVIRPIYYNSRNFRIPVTVQPEGRELVREVRLWVSEDYGYHWKEFGQTGPRRPEFTFRASRDAEYWFALQTVDRQGRVYPADDREAEPSMKVVVDTVRPSVVARPVVREGTTAGVSWEVQDENLKLGTLTIAYQPINAEENDWRVVPMQPEDYRLRGRRVWDSGQSGPLRVRVSVKDKAGNRRDEDVLLLEGTGSGTAMTSTPSAERPPPVAPISVRSTYDATRERFLEPNGPEGPAPLDLGGGRAPGLARRPARRSARAWDGLDSDSDLGAIPPPPTTPERTLLAPSPKFPLQYAVENAGPGGVAKVQLWVTQDGGQTWFPQPEDRDKTSPYEVDLKGDGTYGLWLVVQGVSGLGDLPPTPGTRPNLLVEVDSLAPVLEVDPPRVGTGPYAGKVMITWRASDPHLGPTPVSLSYQAEGARADAPWIPIGRVENTGRQIWTVPSGAPAQFRIKVEVTDALNHRSAMMSAPILVDRARPRGKILGLDKGGLIESPTRR